MIPTGRASSTPRARPTHYLSDIQNFSAFPLRHWCEYFAPSCAPCLLSLCPRLLYPLCLSSRILEVTRSQSHAAEIHHPLTGEAWGVSTRTTRNEAFSFASASGENGRARFEVSPLGKRETMPKNPQDHRPRPGGRILSRGRCRLLWQPMDAQLRQLTNVKTRSYRRKPCRRGTL